MKINNKGSSKGKGWSFFGKALLWSTALIFVSCGFNKKQETNSNIGDFVDFVNLGISVEEKAPTSFGLAGGFNLVAGSLVCDKISYRWGDSASGYNPTILDNAPQAIAAVNFIDNDKFTLKITAFHCKESGDNEYLIFSVDDNVDFTAKTYTSDEVRLYKNATRNDLEVTQSGDCSNGCTAGASIAFSLENFNLEAGDAEQQGAASFQEVVGISFTDGEPIPAFTLEHIEFLNSTYNDASGEVEIGQVWECDIDDTLNTGDNAECSGQLIKNLSVVILDDKSIASGNAFDPQNDDTNDPAKVLLRQGEIEAAIKYRDELQAGGASGEVVLMSLMVNHLIAEGGNGAPAVGTTGLYGDLGASDPLTRHGVKATTKAEPGFYQTLDKYACIYTVGMKDPPNQAEKDWDNKLGAKCQKVTFAPIVQPGG